jgi:hypothetical protein
MVRFVKCQDGFDLLRNPLSSRRSFWRIRLLHDITHLRSLSRCQRRKRGARSALGFGRVSM